MTEKDFEDPDRRPAAPAGFAAAPSGRLPTPKPRPIPAADGGKAPTGATAPYGRKAQPHGGRAREDRERFFPSTLRASQRQITFLSDCVTLATAEPPTPEDLAGFAALTAREASAEIRSWWSEVEAAYSFERGATLPADAIAALSPRARAWYARHT